MKTKIYVYTTIIALIISGVAMFIDYRFSLGVLLASAFSVINLYLLSMTMKTVLKNGDPSGMGLFMGVNIVRFGLLALVIYVAIKNPEIFNIFGVTLGFTLFLISLFIDGIKAKES